jgi:hypothetical protein
MLESTSPTIALTSNACATTSSYSNMACAKRHVTVHSALEEMRAIAAPIERYMYIRSLKQRTPEVFYALLYMHVQEVLPYVYTPTVGEACQKYHALGIQSWGLYLSYEDRGHLLKKMLEFSQEPIAVIVVTDGERILGLGDLGTGGMVRSQLLWCYHHIGTCLMPHKISVQPSLICRVFQKARLCCTPSQQVRASHSLWPLAIALSNDGTRV